jgi:hypothetical protein
MLALTQAIMILAFAAVLFVGVHWLEPNHRLALVLKLAILALGAAAIARPLLPQPYTLPRVHTHQFPTEFAQAQCAVQAKQFWGWRASARNEFAMTRQGCGNGAALPDQTNNKQQPNK